MNSSLERLLDGLSQRKNVLHADRIRSCIEDSQDLAGHGEEGVAFENLCQNLFEWDFPRTNDDYAAIERLGRHYRFEESTWSFLAKRLDSARTEHL